MAKISLPKGSGKWLKVREKSVKSQGILKWILFIEFFHQVKAAFHLGLHCQNKHSITIVKMV